MTERLLLLVGTKKGAFIIESDPSRVDWTIRGPLCDGWSILDLTYEPESATLFGGARYEAYGSAVFRSSDLGASWHHSSEGLSYGESGPPITAIWNVTPAHGSLYAGVDPAGLFRSDDGGERWQQVAGLRDHPSRPDWQPGNGGLILHTIVPHPTDLTRMWVAMSAVGTFFTSDAGRTWRPQNAGVRAEFMPNRYPEFGQCVHKLVMAAGDPERLYQQNHCGVYRSTDAGEHWTEVTEGLPSEFGFAMAAHPRDPMTVWTVPLNGAELGRFVPDGQPAVWRTRDGGDSWTRFSNGLPSEKAYLGVLREAMAADPLEPAGVYFGTSTGQLFGSSDEGGRWNLIADFLPPIWSVDTALVRA